MSGEPTFEFRGWEATHRSALVTLPLIKKVLGPRADGRRRPRRIQRKLDKRGGYRKHNCLGATLQDPAEELAREMLASAKIARAEA